MIRAARFISVFTAASLGAFAAIDSSLAAQLHDATATGTTGLNASSTKPYPSALTTTYAVTGGNLQIIANNVPLTTLGGATAAMFTPPVPTTTTGIQLQTAGAGCTFASNAATSTSCARGSLQVSFSRPVTNPVLHFVGLGSVRSVTGDTVTITAGRTVHTIASSVPAGATMTVLAGASNLQTLGGGSSLDLVNPQYNGTNCSTITAPATQLAGCGSVRINGTYTSLTFDVGMAGTRNVFNATIGNDLGDDGYMLTTTVDEDFGDAPASYDSAAAASHIVGGIRLGTTVDADGTTVFNNTPAITPSPNAVAAGADANGAAGDGADEDGLTTPLPTLHTGMIGQTYTLTPSLSGNTAAGTVCGWIDFNRNGVFDTAEGVCNAVASGATSTTLNWTVPIATTAGRSYVRLRATQGTQMTTATPTGRIDSGEVEDYMIEIKPVVRVIKQLLPAGDGGRFDLGIGGTAFALAVGDTGSTGFRTLYHNSASGAPDLTVAQNIATTAITTSVAEVPTPATTGAYVATYSCINGAGAAVATGTGTSVNLTLPVSVTGAAANGRAQALTCTFSNRLASFSVLKSTPVASISAPGAIPYSILVTNTGAATLNSVTPVDTLPHGGTGAVTLVSGDANSNGMLDPGEAWLYSASYAATQADIDAGTNLVNTVSVTTAQTNAPQVSSATTGVVRTPAMTVQKSTTTTSINAPGTIAYTILVRNSGNVTLTGVTPVDTLPHGANGAVTLVSGDANGNGALDVGETWTYSANYAATQADIDAGTDLVNNVAVTTAQIPAPVTGSATTTVTRAPAMNVVKSTTATAISAPGPIPYTIAISNTGNVTLTGVAPVDTLPNGSNGALTFTGGDGNGNNRLDVGETWTYSASYTATQADISAGTDLINRVAVTTTQITTPVNSSATTKITRADVAVVKTGPATVAAAATLSYTVVASNAGPDAADGAVFSDPLPSGLTNVSANCATSAGGAVCGPVDVVGNNVTSTIATLPSGASVTFSISATAPSNGGTLTNTASIAPPASAADPNPANNTSHVDTTITPVADLSIVKSGPPTIASGGALTYTLAIGNAGPSAADGTSYTDTLPAGLSAVSASCGSASGGAVCATPSVAGGTVSGTLPSLPANGSVIITIQATAPIGAQTISNTATIAAPAGVTDPSQANNSSSVQTAVGAAADIAVTKTVDNPAPFVGNPVTFTIIARNDGPNDASGVALTDNLPFGLIFVSATPSQGTYVASTGVWTVGALTDGASANLTITATVDDPGSLVNTVTVSASDQADPDTSNNSAAAAINAGASADLGVAKSVDDTTPDVGSNVAYTVSVSNNGPNDASAIEVTDAVPAGTTFVSSAPSQGSYDSGSGVWTIGALGDGTTATLAITLRIDQAGSIMNTATITHTDQFDPNPANDTAGVAINGQSADIGLTKTVDVTAPDVGDAVTFTITAHNSGPSDASGVVVTDALPAGLSFVSASPSQGSFDAVSGQWTIGALTAAGPTSSATLTLVANVAQAGALTNSASLTASTPPDPNPANDVASVSLNGTPLADLAVSKTGAATVTPGDDVTYTIVVRNNGPSAATNVVINDATPAGLQFVGNSGDCTTAYPCTVTSLASGATLTILSRYTVPADYAGANPIRNNASASSDTPDPDSANNQAAAQTNVGPGLADLSIDKQGPATLPSGGAITYTLLIVNHGPSPANGASYTDNLPAGISAVTASCAGESGGAACSTQPSVSGNVVTGSIGVLPSGGSAIVTVTGIAPNGPAMLQNTASVAAPAGVVDPDPSNDSSGVSTSVSATASADLGVFKQGPAQLLPGGTASFTLSVDNHGPDSALSVQLDDPAPAGLTFVSATAPCQSGFPCALGDLAAGAGASVTAIFAVAADASGSIVNTATVSSPTPDGNPANNTSVLSVPVATVVVSADLGTSKTGPATAAPGQAIDYTIRVTNHGPSAVSDAVLADPTPPGLRFVAATAPCAGGFPCTLGALANGASVTVQVSYLVQADYVGTIANVATATSATVADPSPSNNTSTVPTVVGGGPSGSAVPVPLDARWMLVLIALLSLLSGSVLARRR